MKEFIEKCKYKPEISEAIAYEKKLSYFIQNHNADTYINSDTSIDGVWNSANPFINWMRGWMRKENFESFMKFLRHPLPTVSLIKDDIIPELKKVFDATNAYYDYEFSSNASKLSSEKVLEKHANFIKETIFPELINNHNSVVVTDFVNKKDPYYLIVKIGNVKAVEPTIDGKIKAIVFEGKNAAGEERYYYYTDQFYSVYIKDGDNYIEESKELHEIGQCPADFISVEPLNSEKFVVREHIFSDQLEKFENYVNYYTLQKMCLPHGAIPVITHYKKNNNKNGEGCGTIFENGTKCFRGYVAGQNGVLGNKDSLIPCPVCNEKTIIQAGTIIGLPVPKFGDSGERPFDLNANFVKFHYIPVDILKWWNEFVNEKYSEIKYQIVGKGVEDSNGQAKNKDQIARGNQTLENTLIDLSGKLSALKASLDFKKLKIIYGKAFKSCYVDMGTDFYLETEFELRDSLAKAIDPIDKENLISRINYSIYKNNPGKLERNNLLYKMLPYSTLTDNEFLSLSPVDPKLKELRLNFKYYIDAFEAEYGELHEFFNLYFGENVSMSEKLTIARKLLIEKIQVYESVQNETGAGKRDQLRPAREDEEQNNNPDLLRGDGTRNDPK
jgi:hypothetical protein